MRSARRRPRADEHRLQVGVSASSNRPTSCRSDLSLCGGMHTVASRRSSKKPRKTSA